MGWGGLRVRVLGGERPASAGRVCGAAPWGFGGVPSAGRRRSAGPGCPEAPPGGRRASGAAGSRGGGLGRLLQGNPSRIVLRV